MTDNVFGGTLNLALSIYPLHTSSFQFSFLAEFFTTSMWLLLSQVNYNCLLCREHRPSAEPCVRFSEAAAYGTAFYAAVSRCHLASGAQ